MITGRGAVYGPHQWVHLGRLTERDVDKLVREQLSAMLSLITVCTRVDFSDAARLECGGDGARPPLPPPRVGAGGAPPPQPLRGLKRPATSGAPHRITHHCRIADQRHPRSH